MKSFKQFVKEQGPPMEKPWFPSPDFTPTFPTEIPPDESEDDLDDLFPDGSPFNKPDWWDEYDPNDSDGDGIPNDQDPDYVEPEPIDLDDIFPWLIPLRKDPDRGTPFQLPNGDWVV